MDKDQQGERQVQHFVKGEGGALVRQHAKPVAPAHGVAGREECKHQRKQKPSGPADELQAEPSQGIHAGVVCRQASTAARAFNPAVIRQTAVTPRAGSSQALTRSAPSAAPRKSAPKRRAASAAAGPRPACAARGELASRQRRQDKREDRDRRLAGPFAAQRRVHAGQPRQDQRQREHCGGDPEREPGQRSRRCRGCRLRRTRCRSAAGAGRRSTRRRPGPP